MSQQPSVPAVDTVFGYRSLWSIVNASGLLAMWIILTVVTTAVVPSLFAKAIVITVALIVLIPLLLRLKASLTIADSGIIVRSMLGTKLVPWSEIEIVDVGSKRVVGSGGKSYFLRYQTGGRKNPIRSTLVSWGRPGRAMMITMLNAAERASSGAGANVTVSRSDPWNAQHPFPKVSS